MEKEGWVVTSQPFTIAVGGDDEYIYADLQLRHVLRHESIIVVEVKCFAKKGSLSDEFYQSIGQYIAYREGLVLADIASPLYLAVPWLVYSTVFPKELYRAVLQAEDIQLIVVDLELEEIVQWNP